MRLGILLALTSGLALPARGADVCNPRDLQGPYGFQLTGDTTISSEPKPAASLGRLVFDGGGGVSGTSSVKFAGLLLGNPVTGTYEARTDCGVSWSLQDDSGAYQHFSGVATSDGRRVRFQQTDPGGAQHGLLVRTAEEECKTSDLRDRYTFTLSGTTIPMTEGGVSSTVAAKGVMEEDGNHHFRLTIEGKSPDTTDVAISVESDCTVKLELAIPAKGDETPTPMRLRGILVDSGKEILAIQTDPGAIVSGRFTAR